VSQVDYEIVLESADPDVQDGSGWLEILPELADEQDAIEALEGWAATFIPVGRVPRGSGDWENETPVRIIARAGRRAYRCRVECWERETETGVTVGAAWLRLREVPR
jgi:hypothetical protein